jgi:hypothetical protein
MLSREVVNCDLSVHHEASGRPSRSETNEEAVECYRRYLTHAKGLVSNIAHDYRVIGHRYHSLPPYIRYHHIARADRIHLDATHHFVVSGAYELPEMITMLGTFEFVIAQIETLLAESVEKVDLRKVQCKFVVLEVQIPYALLLLAKLQTIMRIYVEVVASQRKVRRALKSGTVGERLERRMQNMADRWFDTLPEVCFDGYPEAFDDDEEQERSHESTGTEESDESSDDCASSGSDTDVSNSDR